MSLHNVMKRPPQIQKKGSPKSSVRLRIGGDLVWLGEAKMWLNDGRAVRLSMPPPTLALPTPTYYSTHTMRC